ncbi:MAG: hypothetical protein ABSH22_05620 [Tepidisphaeraceae bacterium]
MRRDGFSVTDPEPTSYGATIARLDGPDSYAIYFQQWNSRAAAG